MKELLIQDKDEELETRLDRLKKELVKAMIIIITLTLMTMMVMMTIVKNYIADSIISDIITMAKSYFVDTMISGHQYQIIMVDKTEVQK